MSALRGDALGETSSSTLWLCSQGYAISGERTLEAFYDHLHPFAPADHWRSSSRLQLPSRSALSRFLSALPFSAVEALRSLSLEDGLARLLDPEGQTGELLDRCGVSRQIFDIDGTREAARQRTLPKGGELPEPRRRLSEVCARGYTGRKRGEVVRTRTVVSQAHSYQWLGSFGNSGNGRYRPRIAPGHQGHRRLPGEVSGA